MVIKPREVTMEPGASVKIPSSSFVLPPRDDASEYDDSGDMYNFQDDQR